MLGNKRLTGWLIVLSPATTAPALSVGCIARRSSSLNVSRLALA